MSNQITTCNIRKEIDGVAVLTDIFGTEWVKRNPEKPTDKLNEVPTVKRIVKRPNGLTDCLILTDGRKFYEQTNTVNGETLNEVPTVEYMKDFLHGYYLKDNAMSCLPIRTGVGSLDGINARMEDDFYHITNNREPHVKVNGLGGMKGGK